MGACCWLPLLVLLPADPVVQVPPPAHDIWRFSTPDLAMDNYLLARGHLNWVRAEQRRVAADEGAPTAERLRWACWESRADHCHRCWCILRGAWVARTDEERRGTLAGLRVQLGDEDYDAGRMPPPMPVEFFRRR